MARQCNRCYQPINDNETICPYCGTQIPLPNDQQPQYQQPQYQQPQYQQPQYQQPQYQQPQYQQPQYQQPQYQQPQYQQPQYQQPYPQQPYRQPDNTVPNGPDMPMKWFKFVIYFQLFAACLSNLGSAIQALTGMQYDGQAQMVYNVFPGLQTADTLYGIVLIAFAVFAIVIRFRLAGYHENGPKLYLGYLACTIIVPIVYGIAASAAMAPYDASGIWPSLIGGAIGSGIVLVCNTIYFNKRKHLFYN